MNTTSDTNINHPSGTKKKIRHLLRLDRPQIRITHRIRTSQTGIAAGVILGILMILATCLRWRAYFDSEAIAAKDGRILFILSLLLSVLTGATAAIRVYLPIRGIRITTVIYYLLMPVLACLMSETICGVFIYNFSPITFGLNYLLFLLIYSVPAVLFGRIRQPILIMTPLIWLASLAAHYVLQFRGTPLMPADLMTIRTGLEVAGGYDYSPQACVVLGTWIFIEIMLLTIKMPTLKIRPRRRNLFRVLSLLLLLCTVVPFYTTDIAANNGIRPDFWNQARGYANRGTILSFVLNTRYLIVEKPDDYAAAEVGGILQTALDEHPQDDGILQTSLEMQKQAAQKEAEEAAQKAAAEASAAESAGAETAGQTIDDDTAAVLTGETGQAQEDGEPADPGSEAAAGSEGADGAEADGTEEYAAPNTGMDTKLAVEETSDTSQPAVSAKLKKDQVPNIIIIMNETLGDLRVLGDYSTNMDYFPFIRNLSKNTIKGNLYMPVNGAGTSNSEFEFLTGNSMGLLPAGSNAYQLYVDTPLPSFTKILKAQGYSATAYHTYYKAGWKRSIVYPLLGFDSFYALEDYFGEDLTRSYREGDISFYQYQKSIAELYPDSDPILLRRFISDSFDYEQLINMYEERDTDKPFYIFNVTMQNHGGYSQSYLNFDEKIYLTSTDEYYAQANRYLSLMYESDRALEKLVDYFSGIKDPTMIVVFGDHQPSIETAFITEIMGKDLSHLTLEENQRRYVTPFLIWTNYESESGYIEKMSSNYLSTLVLQQAGLNTTPYNDYLSALYSEIPVIDTIGYISADNTYYTYDNETRYSSLIDGYEKIEYNYLFDSINRASDLFEITDTEQ